jgi:hypothetical protein
MLWATAPGEPIRRDGSDPTPGVRRQLPEPGGTCFLIIRFPSDSVFAAPSFDAAAASAERRIAFPGVAELLEPDNPGMHTTDSVDYVIVLDGDLWLELDNGQLTRLGPETQSCKTAHGIAAIRRARRAGKAEQIVWPSRPRTRI